MPKFSSSTLNWLSDTPTSPLFEDIYFSIDDGLAETNHVFLDSNQLPERFATASTFTIAETGFGTGLNFLATWKLFREQAPASAKLHFISVEKYPIALDDLIKALALWPELSMFSEQLIVQYPCHSPGFHQLSFDDGRIMLTLMLGDAIDCYRQLEARVDAWFLDGFAPSKNPEMWCAELFQQIGRLSHTDTTFATFTCAGIVKRGLRDVGFPVKKVAGFGRKREMLVGTYSPEVETRSAPAEGPSWFQLPYKHTGDKTAIVIGAGIAGCSTAHSLAKRGWKVTLVDKNSKIAAEGSGNHQGALYAKLPIEPIPTSRIHLSGFLYSSHFLTQNLADRNDIWSPCGLLQLAAHDKEKTKHQKLAESGNYPRSVVRYVEQTEASKIAGTAVSNSGLFFPEAGWVTPPLLCEWLCEHPNITVITSTQIKRLVRDDHQWHCYTQHGQALTAAVTIIASAADSVAFEQTNHLPVQNIRGQVSITAKNADLPALDTVLCSEGYISPTQQGRYCFGATFELKDPATDIRESGHQHNLTKITNMAPNLGEALAQYHVHNPLSGRVGFRCASPDKLPIVGPAPVFSTFIEDYARLRHDAKTVIDTAPQHYPGLFVNLAHGSKGLISCPISGELIATMLENEPLPLEKELIDKLNPARFIIKNLIRRAI
ncbi:bifunctional tRNA (5-methylaminomethyl-2-thiouridine)(34)-methyltransferase MnmD/FAD-dependent 5-carboxymethylaminomethyl-2-thiouridine(34) oxidoreductase MnmC [Amphritea sp. 2_MG-2023]|uniref:bifunctional tRNA (5-methylaminomethyl-2-thiouridine)(34)-methyltransferase MnmD/FAD-dependent 5-carboxymethylaminomethyl-2-thiouridine(34) oxidoreductase MnmC n=1 Tax=Amphritea TaxID=515417 RepID=UPI001C0673EF|nr:MULTISPECIES: bifunctional tRNA (5-methylaminomethyl-2-thiouridine)(34)-methyltransferase MnmD/FAD-dependent 5-carboxymethylaminomethyl-2-thiouridine(34) oxidoreductase MnmC [Amphritea]MBU2964972.1 bifunctional tRNA (5-methylaminomethyl-2-thiouridine)(34)-methyltransferase MnmD/FAD-dependent 5-carboxymethylaminomethyl-2-thiouridine(34) oxidoreductase MnmC [Amphritea atlantica]MDO6419647.1 bifunctional tRNA (5-methylaminomethyl-2-thiouridine)(34)-methyltransferase MnmD/FAD-dependent 5-carboxyme